MNWSDLDIIMTVSQVKSIRKAAEIIHLSQSAISKKIQAVEKEIGIRLFYRSPSGMVLTESGQLFMQYANSAARTLNDGIRLTKMRESHREVTKLGIAAPLHSLVHQFTPCLLSVNNGKTLEILTSDSPTVHRQLREGVIDYGLFNCHQMPEDTYAFPVYRQEYYLWGSELFLRPLLRFRGKTIAYIRGDFIRSVRDIPMILPERGKNMRMLIDLMFEREMGCQPNIVAEVDTMDLVEQLVVHKYGCTIAAQTVLNPRMEMVTDPSLAVFRLEEDKKRGLCRVPVNFLMTPRHVYFAQSTHIAKSVFDKIRDMYFQQRNQDISAAP